MPRSTLDWQSSAGPSASIARVNARARWTIGILVALVIGLVIGLIIVVGDDNDEGPSTTESIQSTSNPTAPLTTTSQTTTSSAPTQTNGGTPAPNPGGTTTAGGTGGL